MSLERVNWETHSKRLSFFSRNRVSAQETALACTSVHTRCSDALKLLQVGCWENRTDWNVSRTFVICFLTSLAAKKKKRKHTSPHHNLTKTGKKSSLPHLGSPRILTPGVYKPDRVSKRDLSQIRVKAMVAFALPGDMWPHTQMSRPSHQPGQLLRAVLRLAGGQARACRNAAGGTCSRPHWNSREGNS